MTFLLHGQISVPVDLAVLEKCCLASQHVQVSELWPMGLSLENIILSNE